MLALSADGAQWTAGRILGSRDKAFCVSRRFATAPPYYCQLTASLPAVKAPDTSPQTIYPVRMEIPFNLS
jgi:hypothetical protein